MFDKRRNKFLDALGGVHLTRVDIAARINSDLMDPVELTRVSPIAAKSSKDLARFTVDEANKVVFSIRIDQESLFHIGRKSNRPNRAVTPCGGIKDELLHEIAIPIENLNAIVGAITDVNETVVGNNDAVDRTVKDRTLFVRRLLSIRAGRVGGRRRDRWIGRWLTVGSPCLQESAALRIKLHDA